MFYDYKITHVKESRSESLYHNIFYRLNWSVKDFLTNKDIVYDQSAENVRKESL